MRKYIYINSYTEKLMSLNLKIWRGRQKKESENQIVIFECLNKHVHKSAFNSLKNISKNNYRLFCNFFI